MFWILYNLRRWLIFLSNLHCLPCDTFLAFFVVVWFFVLLFIVISAKNLYGHAVQKANEMLTRWKDDMPQFEPVTSPHRISAYAIKNKRPGMEDRHVIIPDLRALVDLKVWFLATSGPVTPCWRCKFCVEECTCCVRAVKCMIPVCLFALLVL